jgi:hypothetical protein
VKRIIFFISAFQGPAGPIFSRASRPILQKSCNYPFGGLQKSAFQGPVGPKMQLNVSFFVTPITFLSFAKK